MATYQIDTEFTITQHETFTVTAKNEDEAGEIANRYILDELYAREIVTAYVTPTEENKK